MLKKLMYLLLYYFVVPASCSVVCLSVCLNNIQILMYIRTLLELFPRGEPIQYSCRQNALQHIGRNLRSMAESHLYRRRSILPSTKIDNERCLCICQGPFHTRLRGKSKTERFPGYSLLIRKPIHFLTVQHNTVLSNDTLSSLQLIIASYIHVYLSS